MVFARVSKVDPFHFPLTRVSTTTETQQLTTSCSVPRAPARPRVSGATFPHASSHWLCGIHWAQVASALHALSLP